MIHAGQNRYRLLDEYVRRIRVPRAHYPTIPRTVSALEVGLCGGKGIANAVIAPANAPKMANSTLWVVCENAIPATLIVRGESTAKTSFVAKSDRSKLGITIPAINKVNTTSISNNNE